MDFRSISGWKTEMGCVEAAALKKSFRRESSGERGSPQAFVVDEIVEVNAPGGVPPDDFSIDELLDLSNENGFIEEDGGEERVGGGGEEQRRVEEEQSNGKASVSGFFEMGDFPAVSAGALNVPVRFWPLAL